MTLHHRTNAVPDNPARQTIARSARSMGIYLLAGRGTGKSRLLGRKIAMQDYLAGFPQVIFDPVGATIDNFLDKVVRFLQPLPSSQRAGILKRIRYVDMSGKTGYVSPFPLYYSLGTERSLLEISERYLQVIIKSNPDLFHAQVLGWPPLHRIGTFCGIVLSALGYQITEAEDLLSHPEEWEAAGRFARAEQASSEAKRAVSYFRTTYMPMRQADRARLTTPFLDKIFTFPLDDTLRAMFGASQPGFHWDTVCENRQTVLLDFRAEQDAEMRRFKMLWAFDYLYTWIKTRGRREQPFGLVVDEFAHMTQKVAGGTNPLAQELDEFINVYMRQHQIWFSAAHQELYQIDEQLRNTVLSLGTYIFGATASMESARDLADALFFRDPYWVKYWRPVYASLPRGIRGNVAPDLEPEFMPLEEQQELFAQQIKGLGRFQFLFRPAVTEGQIGTAVLPLTIQHEDCDPRTGECQYPDPPLMARFRRTLAAQSGMPMQTLLAEQESRLDGRRPLRQPQIQDTIPQAHQVDTNRADPTNASRPTRRRQRIGSTS